MCAVSTNTALVAYTVEDMTSICAMRIETDGAIFVWIILLDLQGVKSMLIECTATVNRAFHVGPIVSKQIKNAVQVVTHQHQHQLLFFDAVD
jgi:hypothetical protein